MNFSDRTCQISASLDIDNCRTSNCHKARTASLSSTMRRLRPAFVSRHTQVPVLIKGFYVRVRVGLKSLIFPIPGRSGKFLGKCSQIGIDVVTRKRLMVDSVVHKMQGNRLQRAWQANWQLADALAAVICRQGQGRNDNLQCLPLHDYTFTFLISHSNEYCMQNFGRLPIYPFKLVKHREGMIDAGFGEQNGTHELHLSSPWSQGDSTQAYVYYDTCDAVCGFCEA